MANTVETDRQTGKLLLIANAEQTALFLSYPAPVFEQVPRRVPPDYLGNILRLQ